MSQQAESKSRKLAWTLSGILFFLMIAAILYSRLGNPAPSTSESLLAPEEPVLLIGFADGMELEVFGIGVSEWTDGSMTAPPLKGMLSGFSSRSEGSSGHSYGDEKANLQTDMKEFNDALIGVRVYAQDTDLLLSLRLHGRLGAVTLPESPEMEGITIELSDNAGNWNRGYGPYVMHEELHGRLIAGFGGWPRSGAVLRFRLTKEGHEPVEFELPNPNHGNKAAAWTPTTLPATVSDPDWELTLSEVREVIIPGNGRFIMPDMKFTEKSSTGKGWKTSIEFRSENLLGALGTDSCEEGVLSGSGEYLGRGYRMPQDENLFKIRSRIKYYPNYPYPRRDFMIFASGKVSADGKTIQVTNHDKRMGITELKIGDVTPNRDSGYEGIHLFKIDVIRTYTGEAEHKSISRFFGDWRETAAAVFVDGKTISTGALEANSWGSSQSGASGSYEWGATWIGDLTPGMQLEFGLMPQKPDVKVDIVIERASLIPKSAH